MASVCLKDQKNEPNHEKTWFIGVSEQVVLKTQEAQLHKNANYSFELNSGYMCLSYNYHKIKFSHVGAQK